MSSSRSVIKDQITGDPVRARGSQAVEEKSDENQNVAEVLSDIMTRIEVIKCNISLLSIGNNSSRSGWDSIIDDVNILKKDLDGLLNIMQPKLFNDVGCKSVSPSLDAVNGVSMHQDPFPRKMADQVPLLTAEKKAIWQSVNENVRIDAIRAESIDTADDIQLLLEGGAITSRPCINTSSEERRGDETRFPAVDMGAFSMRSERTRRNSPELPPSPGWPHRIEECKLPLGKKVTASLTSLGAIER